MFVSDWMTKNVVTVGPDESVTDIITLMKEKSIKHMLFSGSFEKEVFALERS